MVLSPFRIVHQLLEERSFYSTLLDKFEDRCLFQARKDELKCSLQNGNAEVNFGDKLSPSLSGMNNLSYTNSQIRFLVNFKTSNATFGVQNSKICEEIIHVEFVYFKEFLCKHMLEIQIKKFACKFILNEWCVLSYVLSKCLLEMRHSHTGYKIQHREGMLMPDRSANKNSTCYQRTP